jgi:prepilin-type N-terminal cleavage/methylation domain-containing protein
MESFIDFRYISNIIFRSKAMNKKDLLKNKFNNNLDSGFSLIEVAIALMIMGTCLAYAMPVILYAKINNVKSEQRAGALVVSQKIFDNIRGKTFGNIPIADTTQTNANLPVDLTTALGRNYNVSVRYCRTVAAAPAVGLSPAVPGVLNPCTPDYREFTITIRDPAGNQTNDNSILYQTQASFTNFTN